MSNSQGRKNHPGWIIVSIILLVLLGIKEWNDIVPANHEDGNNNQIIIGGNNNAADPGQSSNANKILSAVPSELRSNFFLQQKENGCCKTLSGNVAVVVVMVNDSVSQWDDETTAELQSTLQNNSQAILEDAKAYGADLSLTFHYYTSNVTGDVGTDGKKDWQDKALESAGLPETSKIHKHLTKQYAAKEAPVMFVLNKSGRASATVANVEWITMFHQSGYDGFEHELLHVFGAKDYYYPKEVKQWATEHFPDSIMNSGGEEVDALTAYLVGWTDTVADNALAFLKDSNSITADYMQEQNANELLTGKGTKEYENGTYTGDLLRGYRHGIGMMKYNNGGWYMGSWDNGQKVGAGTGKTVYENGSVYEGEYLDGKCHGTGKIIFENGSVYEGSFQNGKFHGQGTYTNVDGGIYTGGWDSGEKSGKGTGKEIYDNGYYEGEFYNGKRHGQGTYFWTTGSKYTGQWTEGERTGYGTYTWPDGQTRTGNWKDGKFVE